MPGVSPPNSEYFLRQLIELKRQFDGLVTNQQTIVSNASDQVVVATGLIPGSNPANYGIAGYSGTTGTLVFALYETVIPDGSGRRQTIVTITRDDGTPALQMADLGTVPGHTHQQALQWIDRSGNIVLADDTTSGTGIARPHIPIYAMANMNISTWPATNAGVDTQISQCYVEYQHPKLYWVISLYCPAGVTGSFTMSYNGSVVGTTTLAGGGGGAFSTWAPTAVAVPAGLAFGAAYQLVLSAHVTAGAGTIYAQPLLVSGVQT